MKALYYDGKRAVYREDAPMPQCDQDQSLIKIVYAAVCSTDKEILKGYRPDFRGIMGHEFVGEVVESPDASLVGKLVVGEMNEGCGTCVYCRTGREKHCPDRVELGLSRDGCFAEYMALSTHLLHPVPEGLSPEQAVFTEPLAAAVEVTEQVKIDPASRVALIGDGRLAFMTAQVLALTGAPLTVIGKHADKLALFEPYAETLDYRSFLTSEVNDVQTSGRNGTDSAQNADGSEVNDVQALGRNGTDGAQGADTYRDLRPEESYDFVVDATGSPSGLKLALQIVRKMGVIVLKSTYAGTSGLNLSVLPIDEITIVGSRCGPFDKALLILQEGKVKFPPVELYDLSDYERAFSSDAFKAGFRM
ncbi:MAG: alcohol dehydrogenase catalytic domain-containing protein [Lachnospiraceae bacterium]|nr:alcohol dehydrogenase catalytic domain-containing protein [Lachnospiraceae bacterium]